MTRKQLKVHFQQSLQQTPIKLPSQTIPKPILRKAGSTKWTKKARKTPHYVTSSEIIAESVVDSTKRNYRGAGRRFYEYLDEAYKIDPSFPKLNDIIRNFDLWQLDVILREYLTAKFNATHNSGKTLKNEACGILYCLAVDHGIALSTILLPSIHKICKGAHNLLDQWYGKKTVGKYPILNPILEAMLDVATEDEQWAILAGHRFCNRSSAMTNNDQVPLPPDCSDMEDESVNPPRYARVRDLHFVPNIDHPRAITLSIYHDKNHPQLTRMDKTVYCTCHTKWTCIVHMAQKRFRNKNYHPDSCLFQCRTGDLTYSAYRAIVRYLVEKIGLDPRNYGTHSLRSGGVSELYIEGKSSIFIKTFCHWKNMGSIYIYIKPNNPDLKYFVSSYIEYRESRLHEMGLSNVVDTHWQSIWQEVKNENQKIKQKQKQAQIQAVLHQVHGPVRGALNKTTFQHRLPMGHPSGKVGPAAQLNSRGQHLQTQNPQQYTNYNENRIQAQQSRNDVVTNQTQTQTEKQWVQTTMGWKQNPFL